MGRRMFRSLFRFVIAVLIGVGATLGWQSRGDEARELVRIHAPSLVGLLPPVSTTKVSVAPATLPELVQQLDPMAQDIAGLRRSVEALTAQQEQMVRDIAQNIAALQAVGQDLRQKTASPPAVQPVATAPSRPQQPRTPAAPLPLAPAR